MFWGRKAQVERGPAMESGESVATEVAVAEEQEEKEAEKSRHRAELYFLLGESTERGRKNIRELILSVLEASGAEITDDEFYQERGGLRQGLKVSLSISAETAKAAVFNAKKLAYRVESGLKVGTAARDLRAGLEGGVYVEGYEPQKVSRVGEGVSRQRRARAF